ncbi:MAG: hypothetical protein OXF41_14660 [bacterium]|nr:hypothetical protein [bacterium]
MTQRGRGSEREKYFLGRASLATPALGLGGLQVGAIPATPPAAGLPEEHVSVRLLAGTLAAPRTMGAGAVPAPVSAPERP